jgi:hypothetical protein
MSPPKISRAGEKSAHSEEKKEKKQKAALLR